MPRQSAEVQTGAEGFAATPHLEHLQRGVQTPRRQARDETSRRAEEEGLSIDEGACATPRNSGEFPDLETYGGRMSVEAGGEAGGGRRGEEDRQYSGDRKAGGDGGGAIGSGRDVGLDAILAQVSASLGLTDYSQVDMLDMRYKSVNFGARKSPGSPNW